ncbi:hypothetical protein PACTADRAFT_68042 [Pachysolen tannophilus NRRL Y-2460]|uniref:Uncharacterized protein n=1 Tax=Pachysolen tannophilus NRRL Y-2460 TaxID=669874 RepID=A0A1E4TXV8_PACTA|nr:hypothetical protein PACTADRAFT_68042 [Pachysolen tannophilus NRRL Y-2460]
MPSNFQSIEDLQRLLELVKLTGVNINQLTQLATSGNRDLFDQESFSEISTPDVQSIDRSSDDYFLDYTNKYIDFTYENPTTFHAVDGVGKLLEENGFTYLSEKSDWSDLKAGCYYTTRSSSSVAAFVVGSKWTPSKGVAMICAHIDALTTKLKPNSIKDKVEGYELLGVAPYAGALSERWWDRDLAIGGRVLIKNKDSAEKSGFRITSKLINSAPRPIAHIASLAPHFGAPAEGPFNKETQMVPIIGFDGSPDPEPTESERNSPLYGKHSLKLLRLVAELADVEVSELYELDLDLYDVQKGVIGGLSSEFLFSPRIDDRICSFSAISSLIEYANGIDQIPEESFSFVACYDNEELGSLSRQGAQGGLAESVVDRVINAYFPDKDTSSLARVAYANSIILSADVTHLYNPNFPGQYLENHKPVPNIGLVVSCDSNGHMATDAVGKALLQQIAELNDDKLQVFQIRNDSRSGGTIGPYLSSKTGARTVEIGIGQLSMHSIRAMTGSKDIGLAVKYFVGFFDKWREVYDSFQDL